jgi:uncharacterized protein YdhG (YjbR/CyaY superfamily)
MARFENVDDYLAAQPKPAQRALERVRAVIRKAVPGADEVISYGIPAYELGGAVDLYFAGWKSHFSLYPATDGLVEAMGDDLARYEISKGTIRFPLDEPVPARLVERIARFRARVGVERAAEKRPPRKASKARPARQRKPTPGSPRTGSRRGTARRRRGGS